MNTAEVDAALREKFSAPEFAIFFEVANGTGGHAARRADAVAMSLWPSRGLELYGFEVKVSRSDWLREKEDPEKAERIYKFMDRWYLVVGDSGIVKEGELPPTWGLMVPRGKQLVVKVEAPKLEPQPISRVFLAALLRRAHEAVAKPAEAELKKSWDEGYKMGGEHAKAGSDHEVGRLREAIKRFQDASGVSLDNEWTAGRIGEAVKRVRAGEHLKPRDDIQRLKRIASEIVGKCDEALSLEAAPAEGSTT